MKPTCKNYWLKNNTLNNHQLPVSQTSVRQFYAIKWIKWYWGEKKPQTQYSFFKKNPFPPLSISHTRPCHHLCPCHATIPTLTAISQLPPTSLAVSKMQFSNYGSVNFRLPSTPTFQGAAWCVISGRVGLELHRHHLLSTACWCCMSSGELLSWGTLDECSIMVTNPALTKSCVLSALAALWEPQG